jgi:hypothetical protein
MYVLSVSDCPMCLKSSTGAACFARLKDPSPLGRPRKSECGAACRVVGYVQMHILMIMVVLLTWPCV